MTEQGFFAGQTVTLKSGDMFQDGEDFEVTVETPGGSLRIFAEVHIDGRNLLLDSLLVYPERSEDVLTVGAGQILEIAQAIRTLAKDEGFERLTFTYHRVGAGRSGRIIERTRTLL